MYNAWKVEIVIPLLDDTQRTALFDAIANAVIDWAPESRTWDPEVSGHAFYDNVLDTRSYKYNVGDRVRVKTDDFLNNDIGTIVKVEPGTNGLLPYEVLLDWDGRTTPFEEYELEAI